MYARSTTFHGRPDNTDAGVMFIKNEAAPMLDTIDGCRGLSMLVDNKTGYCIATSSWESEAGTQVRVRMRTRSGPGQSLTSLRTGRA